VAFHRWQLVLVLAMAMAAAHAQTGALSASGHLTVTYGGADVVAGDSYLLMDEAWKKIEGNPDTRCVLTRAADQTIATFTGPLITMTKTVTPQTDGVDVVWDLAIKPDPRGRNVELCLAIPALVLEHLPVTGKTHDVQRSVDVIELPCLGGDFRLDVSGSTHPWSFDDMRSVAWSKRFRLRFAPPYSNEEGVKARAVMRFRAVPSALPAFLPLAVAKVGNRALTDRTAGDGQGGWTDQGSNDLAAFRPGTFPAQGIPFTVAEPVVVLRGTERPGFPFECAPLPVNAAVERLCFLQTAAWSADRGAPVAEYIVRYADDSEAIVPVRYGTEINDWWSVRAPSRARVAWTGANGETEVALYAMQWKNPRPDIPVATVRMRSLQTACVPIWLAGTGVRTGALSVAQLAELDRIFATRPNRSKVSMEDWIPCPIAWNDGIKAGTALDVSFLNHCPAGKFGFLDTKEGHFVFRKGGGQPVRIWATNAALHGPYPLKEDAPGIARCLARQGVNLVRIHLYAVYENTLIAPDGTLDPTALDKMEFFLYQLKQNGIYTYMDLNDGMLFERLVGHKLPDNKKAKVAAIFNRELIEATKKLGRMLFTHENPYTGSRMCDDPAICLYEITNENSITMDWGGLTSRLCEPWLTELKILWHAWLRERDLPERELPRAFGTSDPDGRRFAAELQKAHLDEMKEFLVELGVKAPICGTNITFTLGDLWASTNMDYTNDHAYWDHTSTLGKFRTYNNKSVVLSPPWHSGTLSSFARAKLVGKPTVASEWNYVYPNHHRCEGLPYTAAYSAYQDWDAPMFYCATGSFNSGRWEGFHENPGILVHTQQTDPATWGLSQICALLYRRRDVAIGRRRLVIRYGPEQIWQNRSVLGRLKFLPAVARIETELVKGDIDAWPMALPPEGQTEEEAYLEALRQLGDTSSSLSRVVSDTGELRRDVAEGVFLVDTPRTQIACGKINRLVDAADTLSSLAVNSPIPFGTVALSSLDGRALVESSRMLLVAVGNARNADAVIEDYVIKNMGRKGPVMAEPVEGSLTVRRTNGDALRGFALDTLTGERKEELQVSTLADGVTFTLQRAHGTIYYELTAE
jgi:hypothetical protein